MIISHKDKFAFFQVPKTGSSTAVMCLRMCGAFDDSVIAVGSHIAELPPKNMPDFVYERISQSKDKRLKQRHNDWIRGSHWTPTQAVSMGLLTIEQLREYDVYAFLREPKDRAISAYCWSNGHDPSPAAMRRDVHAGNFWGIAGVRQVEYFKVAGEQVVEPLDFGDYDNELRRMIAGLGGYEFTEIPVINKSPGRKDADYLAQATHRAIETRSRHDGSASARRTA